MEVDLKSLTTPESVLMLLVAATLDVIGILCLFILDDYWVVDTAGITIFGSWMFIRYTIGSKGATNLERFQNQPEEESTESDQPGTTTDNSQKEEGGKESVMNKASKEDKKELPTKEGMEKWEGGKGKEISMPSTPGTTGQKKMKGMDQINPKKIAQQELKDIGKKALKRFGLTSLAEIIPFFGGLYPGWTLLTYGEITGKSMWGTLFGKKKK